MSKSSLTTHKDDLARVIEYFRGQYDAIYLTGHSLGGLVTLLLNPADIKAVSLWDPSFDVTHLWAITNCLTHLSDRKAYILDYGAEYVLSEDMVEELKDYPNDVCLEKAARFSSPTQMVIPELSIFLASPHTSPAQYDDAFTAPYERKTIDKSDHCFYGQGKDQELFTATLDWFNRF
jgi:dienelactone hydrolase